MCDFACLCFGEISITHLLGAGKSLMWKLKFVCFNQMKTFFLSRLTQFMFSALLRALSETFSIFVLRKRPCCSDIHAFIVAQFNFCCDFARFLSLAAFGCFESFQLQLFCCFSIVTENNTITSEVLPTLIK